MKTVQELFKPYLTHTKHQRQRKIVREKFKDYLPEDKSFLSLFRYINKSPEKYYSENSFKIYFQFLDDEFKKHRDNFKILLSNNNYKINNSIRNLNLICNETWHEEIVNHSESPFAKGINSLNYVFNFYQQLEEKFALIFRAF